MFDLHVYVLKPEEIDSLFPRVRLLDLLSDHDDSVPDLFDYFSLLFVNIIATPASTGLELEVERGEENTGRENDNGDTDSSSDDSNSEVSTALKLGYLCVYWGSN